MSIRQYARAVLALVAAYAVALQAILLVAPVAGPGDFAARPICSLIGAGGSVPAPVVPAHDCAAACLAGCCAAPPVSAPEAAVIHAPEPTRTDAAAIEVDAPLRLSATGAHRSRAPPLG